jgi:hypothetical protein
LLPDHFYGEHRISLQCSKGIPCAFFIPYPDGVSAVKAAAACGVQVIFRHVIPAAIAASQNSMFAENKLPGKVQILFKAVLFIVPAIRFIEVQYFTQIIIGLFIHLKLSKSVLELVCSRITIIYFIYSNEIMKNSGQKEVLILKGFNW